MNVPPEIKGMCLGEDTFWSVSGLDSFTPVFRNLPALFGDRNCILYFEGTSMSPEALSLFRSHAIPQVTKIYGGTIWPKPQIFHLNSSSQCLQDLTSLSARIVSPEIADHFHVYLPDRMIFQWYDACDPSCPIGLGDCFSEAQVERFARAAGASYERYNKS